MESSQKKLPISTLFFTGFMILVGIWFLRGGSYRLYASLFFTLYHLTQSAWLSIILVAVVQNIAFLPLRFLGELTWPKLKEFEDELELEKSKDMQSFLLRKKVHSGDWPVVLYTINFVLLLIAFISAGRVFLLDFYSVYHKIDAIKYLYDWVPYPNYPLFGVEFPFPFIHVTDTMAIGWNRILLFWLIVAVALLVPWAVWNLLKNTFGISRPLFVNLRIKMNRIRIGIIGIVGSLFILSLFVMRNIPTSFLPTILYADLSKQNTTFNIVTSLATFVATIFMGAKHHEEVRKEAKGKYPQLVIDKIYKDNMRETTRNAFLIAIIAYFLTHLMPCSHDLSVLAFEAVYIAASYTIDPILRRKARAITEIGQDVGGPTGN